MKFTLELLLLVFVITVFTPSLFYVCHATQHETILEQDIKAEKVPLKTRDNTVKEEEIAISDDGYSVADRALLREEDHKFQAEINQLMGIIINSLYSNRDIFLRELISNAHDAISKIRFLSLTNPGVLGDHPELDIRIKMDPENGLLHIRDTGIGMTRDDLINNLGSIAKSGTKEFLEKMSSSGSEVDYIGQFGVGFYSTFLVADRVTVTSKHNDDEQYIWEGTGENASGYSIAKDPRGNTLGRGTLITLHVKEDAKKYLDQNTLKQLILRYNEFISYPIFLWSSKEVTKAEPEEVEEKTDEETVSVEEEDEEDDEEEDEKEKTETVWAWERINPNQPLWTRKKSDIKDEDYLAFYKDALKSSDEPLYFTHFKAEGDAEFTALLYIPSSLPFGYWEPGFESQLKLYVKRVFITDDFEEMMPSYLNFVKGVVDSDYFPLNVSREMLQQNKTLSLIKKKLVRKVLAMFQEIADDKENPEKFEKFYKAFATCLKLGIIHDSQNRTRLSKLLRFHSAKKDRTISFEEYIEDMKKGQEEIYYLGGENLAGIKQSPLLERILARGYDVLLLPEPVDEYAVTTIGKYDGKYSFIDISKEGLKLSEADEDKKKEISEKFEVLTEYMKEVLSEKVTKVEISIRLTTSPCAIVSQSWGMSANMERIMKAQALKDERYAARLGGKRVMEINPRHPLIKKLLSLVENGETGPETEDTAHVLFDSAVLNSGFALEDSSDLISRVTRLVSVNLGVDPSEEIEAEEFVEPEITEKESEVEENKEDEEKEDL